MTAQTTDMPTEQDTKGPRAIPHLFDRLKRLSEGEEVITVSRLAKTIGAQGHAPLLMVAAVFMVLPTGMIPGVGGALGVLVAIVGVQMLLGREGVWVPPFFGKRELSADDVERLAKQVKPVSLWLERHMAMRWGTLAGGNVSVSIIAVILILGGGSLLVLGAIPVATPLVGLPIAVFAFGLLARDGVIVTFGYALVALVILALLMLSGAVG